jgi:hypothetical protein
MSFEMNACLVAGIAAAWGIAKYVRFLLADRADRELARRIDVVASLWKIAIDMGLHVPARRR